MNPNPILNLSDLTPQMSRTVKSTREQSSHTPKGKDMQSTENAEPACKNGVCMVTWKPQKPHAA